MQITLTLRGNKEDCLYFVKPLVDISSVDAVLVFRDEQGYPASKAKYIIIPKTLIKTWFKIPYRLLQMVFNYNRNIILFIGIYEIPHGLLALILGWIYRKPSVVCIISNPAYSKLRKGIRKSAMHFIARRATFVTTTGSKSMQYFKEISIPENKLFILPNSIDIDVFKPCADTKRVYDIITLSRLSPEKNLLIFISVIEELVQYFPNLKVAIGGSGPEAELILRTIHQKNLQNIISMLGFVDEKQLPLFFNQGRVFLACSETEGFPRTVIESMSCGIPCVTSNVGDMEDLVKHGSNGFLIEDYTNINDYVDKSIKLLKDKELYTKFSVNARRDVTEKFSYEASTKLWETIISKIKK
ncbi:MAG: glycosyltransferase family 4 protein [Candidatus Atribacteria bacterium]|nr:glycosyltransferase family 4 protein [Candidatus Atribacteria bacterium]